MVGVCVREGRPAGPCDESLSEAPQPPRLPPALTAAGTAVPHGGCSAQVHSESHARLLLRSPLWRFSFGAEGLQVRRRRQDICN